MANTGAPPSSGPLAHGHIAQALLASTDNGRTLDFSSQSLSEISDEAAQELAAVGRQEDDDEGCVTRIALVYNNLTSLPSTFTLISRLRYLNLKGNAFNTFPDVLTNIPSLEILDISRNKIRSLPERAGTLRNLRVFSLSKNKLEQLPAYLVEFTRLKMLKIDHNPIDWPPPNILRLSSPPENDEKMELWITELRGWLRDNAEDEGDSTLVQSFPGRSDAFRWQQSDGDLSHINNLANGDDVEWHPTSSSTPPHPSHINGNHHSRAPSDDSKFSPPLSVRFNEKNQVHRDDQLNVSTSFPSLSSPSTSAFLLSTSSLPTPAAPVSFQNGFSPPLKDDHLNGNPNHGRNASYSVAGGRTNVQASNLLAKKSLPDLRLNQNGTFDRKVPVPRRFQDPMRRVKEETGGVSGLPSFHSPPVERHSPSRPTTGRMNSNNNQAAGPAPPMDIERNSYFKRLSTLPSSTISKTIPEALLKTVDSVRGILFAVSQMYTAIRHYTVFGIDDRLSGVLGRVLDPASTYMGRLINALDRFDSMSRRGLPSPVICRALLENCRDNVAIFGKVVGVLQAQLKVLAGTDDVRYSRTLLLMLYGAMGEISSSWNGIASHLEAIAPLLSDYRPPPASKSHASSSNKSNITPIPESPPSPPRVVKSPSTQTTPSKGRTARRNAGSFSQKDVQLGRSLAASQQSSSSDTPTPTQTAPGVALSNGSAGPLRSIMRGQVPIVTHLDASSSPPSSVPPFSSTLAHSRQNSANSMYNSSNGSRSTPTIPLSARSTNTLSPGTPLVRSRTSDLPGSSQLVDRDLLATMDTATNTAQIVWSLVDEVLNGDGGDLQIESQLREAVGRARVVTGRLRTDIDAIREGYLPSDGRALSEDAHSFARLAAKIFSMIKEMSANYPLSPELRDHVGQLAQATKEFTILLHVSSFSQSPTSRPFSPGQQSFSTVLEDARNASALGRSRSATASQQVGTALVGAPSRDAPWSAMPHQTFRVPLVPLGKGHSSDVGERDLARRRL